MRPSCSSGCTRASSPTASAIGGVLIAAVGIGWCFAINAATFLAVLTGLLLMRPSELYKLEARSEGKAGAAIREGLRYARRTPEVWLVLAITAVVATTGFNFRVLLPVLASKTLHSSATIFGVLFSSFGAGALLGALAAAAMSRASWRAVVLGAAGFSSAMLLLAPVHNWGLAAALLLVVGFCFSTWTANSQSILQLTAPAGACSRCTSSSSPASRRSAACSPAGSRASGAPSSPSRWPACQGSSP